MESSYGSIHDQPAHCQFTKVSALFYLQNSFFYFILVVLNYKLKFLILFNYNLSVESKIEMIQYSEN